MTQPANQRLVTEAAGIIAYAPKDADWTASTNYVVGQLVAYSGILYRTATAHTSTGSFDGAKFASVGGGGGTGFSVVTKTADYTALPNEIVKADATSNNIAVTVSSVLNVVTIVKKVDSSSHNVRILPASGTIDGSGFVDLKTYAEGRIVVGDGTNVQILGERKPFGSPSALGGPASDGTSSLEARADHIHDTSAVTGSVAPTTVSSMSTSHTFDLSSLDIKVFNATLDAASCAITFTGFPASKFAEIIVRLIQDGTGGRLITFVNTINWVDGYPPVLNSTPSSVTQFLIYSLDGGTTIIGAHGQKVRTHTFVVGGALVNSTTGKIRDYFETDAKIVKVRASVGDTPVSTSAVMDLNKGGTTMYSTQGNRPSVAASGFTAVATLPDITSISPGEYLTVDVDTASSAGNLSLAVTTVEV